MAKDKLAQRTALKEVKPRGKGKPFEKGNPYAFKKGESGNPGGRPKSISGAYKLWLEQIDDRTGLTHAQLVAQAQGGKAILYADTIAAKELRQATEGDLIRNLSQMTDAELDQFIEERQRGSIPGVSGEGTAPTENKADSEDAPTV